MLSHTLQEIISLHPKDTVHTTVLDILAKLARLHSDLDQDYVVDEKLYTVLDDDESFLLTIQKYHYNTN